MVLVDHGRPLEAAGPFLFVLEDFAPVREAWLSWIDPGGFITPHRDKGPYYERWQVPIQPAGTFTQGEQFEPVGGVPFLVRHWEPHSVANQTDRPRIHLVIDRDVPVPVPCQEFKVFSG